MRIGDYVVRPDGRCWIVATIKTYLTGSEKGEEYEADVVYPARFNQALRTLLDRQIRDGLQPEDGLEQAVGRVEHIYAAISDHVRQWLRTGSSAVSLAV